MSVATRDNKDPQPSTSSYFVKQFHHFKFSEILLATRNFDESLIIGSGGYAKVYRGTIFNGSTRVNAAFKRLNSLSEEGKKSFLIELEVISRFHNSHIVSLIGFCSHGKEMILVYEYMSRGSLADVLHGYRAPLSWHQRVTICISAACGLEYLHSGMGGKLQIIHRDVKSSNILLDESWDAKITDFGLSTILEKDETSPALSTSIKGTFGYLDPDQVMTGRLTMKSDVYAFGVVLFEVLCRRVALDTSLDQKQWGLASWAQNSMKKGNLKHIIDSEIMGEISPKSLNAFAEIAGRCLQNRTKKRPAMSEVVASLKYVLTLQEKSNKSSKSVGKITLGRMLNMFSISSHGENSATRNFDESLIIGSGGYAKVYRGTIFNGSTRVNAAFKRLNSLSEEGKKSFLIELEVISRFHNSHIVSLIGFCSHGKEMILVYEYMSRGSLADVLHGYRAPLSWHQRVTICISAACGLEYLHSGMGGKLQIIHRDVKSSNILLDESWDAKITDFGLSTILEKDETSPALSTSIKGTFGYLDPDQVMTGRLTMKSDVYAFGVVLFEVLCRRVALDTSLDQKQWGLASWAQNSMKKGNLKHIIDSEIMGEISPKSLNAFAEIAGRCLQNRTKKRPAMSEVVASLKYVLTLQEKSNKSSKSVGKITLGRMLNMFSISSHGENSGNGDLKQSTNSQGNNISYVNMFLDTSEVSTELGIPSPNLKVYTFTDLVTVTSNFSLYMPFGRGGFGKVFLGWVDEKTFAPSHEGVRIAVAVKRCYLDSFQRHAVWLGDVSLLERLVHGNIVSLLGYCSDEHKYFLVYEYMQNRSLDQFLYGNAPHIAGPLSWKTRLRIMIDAARGLTYLHSSKDQVVCGVVKTSDILLDQDFNAKLGDFGLTKFGRKLGETIVSTNVMVPLGYIDQHYFATVWMNFEMLQVL
ncbi:serine/threonine/dual specificity protein kinase, catalytic domain-containing protein [Artemisia annua]|uniref:Serine/threonine/dual specificity protein kinase, catalytic domain-containing protein n=1 Tax=Artemisia annua TaxID=35608 RepID=A0A2U1MPV1_ARTAN|nr:serine/threonine/dual specificity protein kinase, catalytic domain-containing protein [Artemisia annua]